MANTVIWFDSDEVGAPTLNNAAGALDAVLYACLVTGFGLVTLTSLTVSGGVATATKAGHGFGDQRIVEIAGATGTGASTINGRQLATVTGSGTFTFPAPGVPDGAVSGTITAKRAPLGWSRAASSGNVSIYTRNDVTATTMALRIDDSGAGVASATYARARMVESWTDVSTYSGLGPTSAQAAGGVYWIKGADTAAAKPWVLVGDGRTIYLLLDGVSYPTATTFGIPEGVYAFGDIASWRAGDAYGCIICGSDSATSMADGVSFHQSHTSVSFITARAVLARAGTGIGSAVGVRPLSAYGSGPAGNAGPGYPSGIDNGMVIEYPVMLAENAPSAGNPVRGVLRGVGFPLANLSAIPTAQSLHRTLLPSVIGSDRRWLLLANRQGSSSSIGVVAFDITGPW